MAGIQGLTAIQIRKGLSAGKFTAVDVVESLLARIERVDPQLQAWVHVHRDGALADAEESQRILESGSSIGLLHGVPIGLKDIIHSRGIPTTACSEVYETTVPSYDATAVGLLKGAGAIVLGKTVTTEFAWTDPPPTKNPWNADYTPGGSSSGSAVSVSTNMCPVALGTQTIGSVLRPASYNGVVGFKPTFGRVSRHGVVPFSRSLDTVGWMTRSVEDAAILLQVMAGADPRDPVTSHLPTGDYLSELESGGPPRIGLLRGFFMEEADSETQKHVEGVAAKFAREGATIEEFPSPESFGSALEDQRVIAIAEGAAVHQEMFEKHADRYRPLLRETLREGLSIKSVTYSQAQERRGHFCVDMQFLSERADILLTPTTPSPALPDLTNTGNAMFQGPWTSCGLPTITLPSGVATSGLPLGIQLVASSFEEGRLFSAARWCEDVLDVSLSPPLGEIVSR